MLAALALLLWLTARRDIHLAVATASVAAVLIDWGFARTAVSRSTVEVRGPDEIQAGRPAPWTVRVLGWRRPVALSPLLMSERSDVMVADERPAQLAWPPLDRGLVPFLVVDARARGPLGLVVVVRRHVIRFPLPLPVTPAPRAVEIDWPRPRAVAFGGSEGAPIGDDLFRAVRPYRSGDERRRVHWKATAHHGELMVRESDGLGIVRVRLVVDLGAPGPAAEEVASVAADVAAQILDRGWGLELVTLDAADALPRLLDPGVPTKSLPKLEVPRLQALPTIVGPVRTAAEARRRLASAAHGPPAVPSTSGHGLECRVSPAGVVWG